VVINLLEAKDASDKISNQGFHSANRAKTHLVLNVGKPDAGLRSSS